MKDNARTIKYDSITSYAKEYGVENLSNENLIASIIGIDPMLQGNEPIRKIFDGSHSLRKASKRTLLELTSIKGIGVKEGYRYTRCIRTWQKTYEGEVARTYRFG